MSPIKCAAESCRFGAVVIDGDGKPWCGSPHVWVDGMQVTRNDPCPCGSGEKFKRCCLPAKRCFIRSCRSCGCTEAKACRVPVGEFGHRPCHWVGANLCSACSPRPLMHISSLHVIADSDFADAKPGDTPSEITFHGVDPEGSAGP